MKRAIIEHSGAKICCPILANPCAVFLLSHLVLADFGACHGFTSVFYTSGRYIGGSTTILMSLIWRHVELYMIIKIMSDYQPLSRNCEQIGIHVIIGIWMRLNSVIGDRQRYFSFQYEVEWRLCISKCLKWFCWCNIVVHCGHSMYLIC